ncbi:MAG: c-type cytochrome biogenesis protein CcmI [Pseudomonadota bacterium]
MITFWAVAAILTGVVALILARTAWVARENAEEGSPDVEIYKAQLAEVDRDVARGTISEADADTLRTEIARRLLAADAAAQKEKDNERTPMGLTVVLALLTVGGAMGLYAVLGAPGYGDMPLQARLEQMEEMSRERPSQATAQRAFISTMERPAANERHLDLVAELRAAVADRPTDLRGLALLARNEALLGNFGPAIAAQQQIITVKGEEASGQDHRDLAELMIVATGGYVSPEAEVELRQAALLAPTDPATRYYLGLMYDQSGRADRAFALWQPLFDMSTPDDPWYAPIEQQILATAERAGVRYVLPEGRGPSQEEIAAAAEMAPEDRAAMIEGMVTGLAQRLATQGGPPEDWARLISANAVLGDRDAAQTILDEARLVFQDRADALNLFARTAAQTGLQ